MKKLASLGISLVLVGAAIGVPSSRPAAVAAQSRAAFQVEEATIAGIHAAITSGQTTCGAWCRPMSIARRPTTVSARRSSQRTAPISRPQRLRASWLAAGVPHQDRQGVHGISRPESACRTAARLRPHGAHRVRSGRRRPDGHAGRDPECRAAERARNAQSPRRAVGHASSPSMRTRRRDQGRRVRRPCAKPSAGSPMRWNVPPSSTRSMAPRTLKRYRCTASSPR